MVVSSDLDKEFKAIADKQLELAEMLLNLGKEAAGDQDKKIQGAMASLDVSPAPVPDLLRCQTSIFAAIDVLKKVGTNEKLAEEVENIKGMLKAWELFGKSLTSSFTGVQKALKETQRKAKAAAKKAENEQRKQQTEEQKKRKANEETAAAEAAKAKKAKSDFFINPSKEDTLDMPVEDFAAADKLLLTARAASWTPPPWRRSARQSPFEAIVRSSSRSFLLRSLSKAGAERTCVSGTSLRILSRFTRPSTRHCGFLNPCFVAVKDNQLALQITDFPCFRHGIQGEMTLLHMPFMKLRDELLKLGCEDNVTTMSARAFQETDIIAQIKPIKMVLSPGTLAFFPPLTAIWEVTPSSSSKGCGSCAFFSYKWLCEDKRKWAKDVACAASLAGWSGSGGLQKIGECLPESAVGGMGQKCEACGVK